MEQIKTAFIANLGLTGAALNAAQQSGVNPLCELPLKEFVVGENMVHAPACDVLLPVHMLWRGNETSGDMIFTTISFTGAELMEAMATRWAPSTVLNGINMPFSEVMEDPELLTQRFGGNLVVSPSSLSLACRYLERGCLPAYFTFKPVTKDGVMGIHVYVLPSVLVQNKAMDIGAWVTRFRAVKRADDISVRAATGGMKRRSNVAPLPVGRKFPG